MVLQAVLRVTVLQPCQEAVLCVTAMCHELCYVLQPDAEAVLQRLLRLILALGASVGRKKSRAARADASRPAGPSRQP